LAFWIGDCTEKNTPSKVFSVSSLSSVTILGMVRWLEEGCSTLFFFSLVAEASSSESSVVTASEAFLLAAIRARRPELAAEQRGGR